jgi:hypothetical protein
MDSARPSSPIKILDMKETAQRLAVSMDILLKWNDLNILKPTITSTGEIGYSEEQINHFIAIQKITTVNNNSSDFPNNYSPIENQLNHASFVSNNQTQNNFSQINNYNFYSQPPTSSNKNGRFLTFFGIFAVLSVFIISLSFAFLLQQNKINPLLYQKDLTYVKETDNSPNNSVANQKTNLNDELSNEKISRLNNEGDSVSKNKFNSLGQAFDKNISQQNDAGNQIATLGSLLEKGVLQNINLSEIQTDVNNYSQKGNFIKSADCPTCSEDISDVEKTVFDTEGNIKVSKTGEMENKTIASALGISSNSQTQNSIQQNPNSVFLFGFLIVAMVAIYATYGINRHPSLVPANLDKTVLQPVNYTGQIEVKKVMEVLQKTDGTVVFYLQGKEYKISKPELDSESDKFIQRIMELSWNKKEVEYDCLSDDKFAYTAPLSKIVTRLGFVGIKRDLFFPRTSKTRVLFRRYLTQDDLIAMNYTPDQILNEFIIN